MITIFQRVKHYMQWGVNTPQYLTLTEVHDHFMKYYNLGLPLDFLSCSLFSFTFLSNMICKTLYEKSCDDFYNVSYFASNYSLYLLIKSYAFEVRFSVMFGLRYILVSSTKRTHSQSLQQRVPSFKHTKNSHI